LQRKVRICRRHCATCQPFSELRQPIASMAQASSRDVDYHFGSNRSSVAICPDNVSLATLRASARHAMAALRQACSLLSHASCRAEPSNVLLWLTFEGECRYPHRKNRTCGFYLRSIGNWNLNPSKRDINLYLGAASGHLCQPCFRLAGTDNIANREPPLPNAWFTGRDGIFDTPVNHPISSIDFIEKGQARSLTTRPLTVCPARYLLSNIARA